MRPSPVVSMIIVEYPINGVSISTEDILFIGIVVSLPLKSPGRLNVTACSSIIITQGKILLPSDKRDAVY